MCAKGKKIAFLGGTFDPVHLGHLLMAQDAFEEKGLGRVYFIPAARNPLKRPAPEASPDDRRAMLEQALAGDARFGLLDWELAAGGVSYTVETARRLRRNFPGSELYWIIGSDQLPDLARWREIGELAGMVRFLCALRPGAAPMEPGASNLRVEYLRGHPFQVSSTEIRQRIKARLPADFFLPFSVREYIFANKLYV